jgi:hypothetical protein
MEGWRCAIGLDASRVIVVGLLLLANAERQGVVLTWVVNQTGGKAPLGSKMSRVRTLRPRGDILEVSACASAGPHHCQAPANDGRKVVMETVKEASGSWSVV